MADVEDTIAVHNLQVEYDKLTNAIPTKAAELSLLYKDIERAKSELKEIEAKKAQSLSDIQVSKDEVDSKLQTLTRREEEHKASNARLSEEYQNILKKVQEANKELARANARVIAAETDYQKYLSLMRDLDDIKAQLVIAIATRDEIAAQTILLDGERIKILADISTKIEGSESKLKAARDELATLVHLAEQKRIEADQAQSRVKTYTDELYTHMNDYQIVRERFEQNWKESFPELAMPLF